MTPFIDVVLVLLIIFMVAAPMMTVGVPLDLPQSKASPLNSDVKRSPSRSGRTARSSSVRTC